MNSSTPSVSPLRQRMIDDMRMRKLDAQDAEPLHPRRAQARRASSGARPTPPPSRICGASSCTWSITGTSPITLNATITGLKFFFDVTLGRGELMAKMQPVRVPRTLPVVLEPRGGRAPDRRGAAT